MQGDGPPNARVMIVGEAPGEYEMLLGKPFVGPSGQELDRMLHETGLLRSECFVTNVCRERPNDNDIEQFFLRRQRSPGDGWSPLFGGWAMPPVVRGAELLAKEIELVKPGVIIPVGNLALLATASRWGIGNWRGSTLRVDGRIVLPTYHPAAVLREWSLRSYVIHDLRRAKDALERGVEEPHYEFVVRPYFQQACYILRTLLWKLSKAPLHISCDIETRAGHIACVGFAWSRTEALCIPLMCLERPEGFWSAEEEEHLIRLMRQVLEHPNARISGQNFIYDTQYLWRWFRCRPRLAWDTMLGYHVCFPGMDKDLATLSSLFCAYHVYWKDDGKEWEAKMDEEQLWYYNCEDAVRTYEIAEEEQRVVAELGLEEPCFFQHQMWWHALETMIRGIRVDAEAKKRLSTELLLETTAREQWLQDVLGHPLNVRSTPQMKALFYDDFRLPVQRSRKTKQPTLDDEALDKLAQKEPLVRPIIKKIREIRSLGVFRSTFVEARQDRDGRIRCSYNVAGTETFRFSSSQDAFGSGLNLQNIPKGEEAGEGEDTLELPNVRKLFLPDPGYEAADMDLDSADLRIVVAESRCAEMQAMLDAGLKPYVEVAKEYYHDPSITKHHPKYGAFKSLCHGTNYLGSAHGIAPRVGLLIREVERIQAWYFGKFPEIKAWQESLKEQMRRTRQVSNKFGYRRYYFDRVEESMFREGVAWIPQSTVGLLINKIWDRIVKEEPAVQILLQVHDSLVMQYPADRAAYYRKRVQELSRVEIPYDPPLVIPTGFKYSQKNWGECG